MEDKDKHYSEDEMLSALALGFNEGSFLALHELLNVIKISINTNPDVLRVNDLIDIIQDLAHNAQAKIEELNNE